MSSESFLLDENSLLSFYLKLHFIYFESHFGHFISFGNAEEKALLAAQKTAIFWNNFSLKCKAQISDKKFGGTRKVMILRKITVFVYLLSPPRRINEQVSDGFFLSLGGNHRISWARWKISDGYPPIYSAGGGQQVHEYGKYGIRAFQCSVARLFTTKTRCCSSI